VLIFVWSLLAGYFAFTDLNISKVLVNPQSGWAIFLEQYGELPGLLVIIIGVFLFSMQLDYTSKLKLLFVGLVLIVGGSTTLLYLLFVVFRNITGSELFFYNNLYLIALCSLTISTLFLISGRVFGFKMSHAASVISKVIVMLAFYGYFVFIQLIKIFWGRVRFRDLDALFLNFTEWYLPNGLNGHQSFPSGHAAMGWMLLPLILLVISKNIFIKSLIIGVISIWATTVALSRIVIGAHYPSDVLFGSCFIILVFIILYKKYLYNSE
jgi:membrane-associated phospholipid phosphatase